MSWKPSQMKMEFDLWVCLICLVTIFFLFVRSLKKHTLRGCTMQTSFDLDARFEQCLHPKILLKGKPLWLILKSYSALLYIMKTHSNENGFWFVTMSSVPCDNFFAFLLEASRNTFWGVSMCDATFLWLRFKVWATFIPPKSSWTCTRIHFDNFWFLVSLKIFDQIECKLDEENFLIHFSHAILTSVGMVCVFCLRMRMYLVSFASGHDVFLVLGVALVHCLALWGEA